MGVASFAVALVITAVLPPGLLQDPRRAILSVDPPGPSFYVGEMVSLRCGVRGDLLGNWTFRWYRGSPETLLPGASGDRYTIAGAHLGDQGSHWCRAERTSEPSASLLSNAVNLTVSDLPPATLRVHPSSTQQLWMEKMILHCPAPERNSTGWTLRHLADSRVQSGCRPVGGDASREKPEVCTISRLYSGNSGLYWCESDEGDQRTNAVNITVVYGHVSIQGPTQPVAEGDSVTLRCLHWQKSANTTAFYRNGVEILPQSGTEMTIHSATIADQGFYKCAVPNDTESPETWLSVRGNLTFQPTFPTEVQTSSNKGAGSWLMVVVPCCILGILVVVALGLLAFRHSGCSLAGYFGGGSPKEEVPQTKPDATEIQWDLPWMEMEATLLGRTQEPELGN